MRKVNQRRQQHNWNDFVAHIRAEQAAGNTQLSAAFDVFDFDKSPKGLHRALQDVENREQLHDTLSMTLCYHN